MGDFFSGGFFGSDPTSFFTSSPASPTPSSSTGGGSSTTDWLSTIYKFAQLGTQTYLAQDALNSKRPQTITFGPNGQPLVGAGALAASGGGVNSILGTSSLWLFLFVALLFLLLLRR